MRAQIVGLYLENMADALSKTQNSAIEYFRVDRKFRLTSLILGSCLIVLGALMGLAALYSQQLSSQTVGIALGSPAIGLIIILIGLASPFSRLTVDESGYELDGNRREFKEYESFLINNSNDLAGFASVLHWLSVFILPGSALNSKGVPIGEKRGKFGIYLFKKTPESKSIESGEALDDADIIPLRWDQNQKLISIFEKKLTRLRDWP